jgi:hypothetical protein
MPRGFFAVVLLSMSAVAVGQGKTPTTPKTPAAPAPQNKAAPPARAVEPAVDAKGGWEALAGLTPAPTPPAVLFQIDGVLYLMAGRTISRYEPETNVWKKDVAALPALIGMGAAATVDPVAKKAYLLQGGDRGFWTFDATTSQVDALVRLPRAVGRGGALAYADGKVYALRGSFGGEFYVYDLARNGWTQLPNIGRRDEAKGLKDVKVVGAGYTSGFLLADRGYVYAWPDHHVQRYEIASGTWFERTWTSFGYRPNCDGGSFAWDPETALLWTCQGMDSNAIGVWDPTKQGPGFNLLRPRLPEPLHGEGSRAAIAKVGGKKHLFVYAPEPGNRLWRIPLERLERIRRDSRAADLGLPFETFHEDNGSSLVRRPGPTAIEGVLGAFADRFYFMRLDGLRVCDPVRDQWTDYPGTSLGGQMSPGAFGVSDGGEYVYFSTGMGDDNPKKPRPSVFGRMNPLTKAMQPLAAMPARPGRGSRAVFVEGKLYALRGGATRDVFVFDPATLAWTAGPALPAEAGAPGAVGSGLAAVEGKLYAFPDEQAWTLDLKNLAAGWTKSARLPWRVGVDGGMTAADPVGRAIYLVRGDVSRHFGRVDLVRGVFERLGPDLPDVVSVEGERAVVRESEGKRVLFVMRGHDSHEIWRVALEQLKPAP